MKIVCFGSVNRDNVYNVDHLPVNGETVLSFGYQSFWGGKGLNQAIALARSHDGVYLAGFVNHLDAGVKGFLTENNVHSDYVETIGLPTGHANICVDMNGQNCITVFSGSNHGFTDEYVDKVLAGFNANDILLFQNETNNLEYVIRAASARGLRLAINPSPFSKELLNLPLNLISYFLINEIEGQQITGQKDKQKIIAFLAERFPDATVVLTLGSKGVICHHKGMVYTHGVYDVPVIDTTAAGDTFTGYFLSGAARGLSMDKVLEQASKASSIAVSREGASSSIPSLAEVARFYLPEIKAAITF